MRVIHNHYGDSGPIFTVMNLLVWGVIAAVICLLQIPAVHYLSRYFEQDRESPPDAGADLPVTEADYPDTVGRCPRCHTQTDPAFSYCENCLAPL